MTNLRWNIIGKLRKNKKTCNDSKSEYSLTQIINLPPNLQILGLGLGDNYFKIQFKFKII